MLLEDPTDLPCLDENLDMYSKACINTVLIPIVWYSFEPEENRYDYTMIDALIAGCRQKRLKLIVLRFGAIKNGGLHFVPGWVRHNKTRFFRAKKPNGSDTYAVSPFCRQALEADKEAFVLLMRRIKQKDKNGNFVIIIQPENETGCQEIDNDCDNSEPATQAWNSKVPSELMNYLREHDGKLISWLQNVWNTNGRKTDGTWPVIWWWEGEGSTVGR